MNKKRFYLENDEGVKYEYSEIREYIDEKHISIPLRNDELCKILNEQQITIKKLNKQNEQLKKELDNFKPIMFQDMRNGTVILYAKGVIDE